MRKGGVVRIGLVGLTVGAFGCEPPGAAEPPDAQQLFKHDRSAQDSRQGEAWKKYLSATALHGAWAPPAKSPWRPYYKPTLPAAVSIVRSAAAPVRSTGASSVEQTAAAFSGATDLRETAVFLDLTGEESVAWAAALVRAGKQPVLTINNWPHQKGVLRLERALGALLYYADEVAQARLHETVSPAFVLEGGRLQPRGHEAQSHLFDNRFFHTATDFPPAAALKSAGLNRILYVNHRGTTAGSEEDDLVEYFAALAADGIAFAYVKPGLGTFQQADAKPARRSTIFSAPDVARYASSSPSTGYYHRPYGGYHHYHGGYWSRSSGAWGGSSSGGGGSSGFSS